MQNEKSTSNAATTIADVGPSGSPTRIALIRGGRSGPRIDVRRWWTNDEDKLCPSRKGVRFVVGHGREIAEAILKGVEESEDAPESE